MPLYDIPPFRNRKPAQKNMSQLVPAAVFVSAFLGFVVGAVVAGYFFFQVHIELQEIKATLPELTELTQQQGTVYQPSTSQEQAIVDAVNAVSPAVVSIVISKDVPVVERYFTNPFEEFEQFFGPSPFEIQVPQQRLKGFQHQEVGQGTGFLISEDGMIITNKHVVADTDADYTVFTNDGRKFTAQVLARDPVQDLAVLKIDQENVLNDEGGMDSEPFPTVQLGDSGSLQIGQTVVAIGNALGEFRNTVSVGVISGLGRSITASGGGVVQTLEDVIQTDAAINRGNSGGPLLNLRGEVIGINTAMAIDAQSIGFAIPIDKAKRDIAQVKALGKIVYAFLGIRYVVLNEHLQQTNELPVSYGAWIVEGDDGPGITPGSAAEEAGLKTGDIILEFNGERITRDNSLAKIIGRYNPADTVTLKVLRDGEERMVQVTLGERSD